MPPQLVRHAPATAAGARPDRRSLEPAAGPRPAAAISRLPGGWTATDWRPPTACRSLYAGGRVGAGQTVGLFELEPFTASDVAAYQACYGTHVPITDRAGRRWAPGVTGGRGGTRHRGGGGARPGRGHPGLLRTQRRRHRPHSTPTRPWSTRTPPRCCPRAGASARLLIDPGRTSRGADLFALAAGPGPDVAGRLGGLGSERLHSPSTRLTELAVDDPADQPDVTGVGGTPPDRPPRRAHPTETAWNSTGPSAEGGGGGTRSTFRAPSWQQAAAAQSSTPGHLWYAGDAQCRRSPTSSASADPAHGDIVFWAGATGGRSAARARPRRCGRRWWPTPTRVAPPRPACSNPRCTAPAPPPQLLQRRHASGPTPVRGGEVLRPGRLRPGHRVGQPPGGSTPRPALGSAQAVRRSPAWARRRARQRRHHRHHHGTWIRHRHPGGRLRGNRGPVLTSASPTS